MKSVKLRVQKNKNSINLLVLTDFVVYPLPPPSLPQMRHKDIEFGGGDDQSHFKSTKPSILGLKNSIEQPFPQGEIKEGG